MLLEPKADICVQSFPDSIKNWRRPGRSAFDSEYNETKDVEITNERNSAADARSTRMKFTICGKRTSGAHNCRNCGEKVHVIYAQSFINNKEGHGKDTIVLNKEIAYRGLKVQAEKTKQL